MRELNRRAFQRIVCDEPGIQILEPLRFSVDGVEAAEQLSDVTLKEMSDVFTNVGGLGDLSRLRLSQFVRRLGSDDCLSIDGKPFVVEYDEVLHFSPFRKTTLESKLYDNLAVGFDRPAYLAVCGTFRVTGGSGRAHNPSAHQNFRCPVSPGECRHRQRALYDFLKDVILGSRLSMLPGIIRISDRTDFVEGRPPGEVVEDGTAQERRGLCNLLRQRATEAAP